MLKRFQTYKLFSLIVFSISTGIVWRLEVEFHGWDGLIWIGYFHYAVLGAIVFFLLWLNLSLKFDSLRRLLFTVTGIITALFFVTLYYLSLSATMTRNPLVFVYLNKGAPLEILLHSGFLLIPPLIPMVSALISRLFGIKCNVFFVGVSTIMMIVSPLLSEYILDWTHHRGGADYIHAIKSGYLIALWFFALGLTFIGSKRKVENKNENHLLDDAIGR